jgi:hypothetical protein
MMLIQANIHENRQNACDMANHDVWFFCAVQNYFKSLVSVHDDQRLQLINRDGQEGDPGKDKI